MPDSAPTIIRVTELPLALEAVAHDPFVDDLAPRPDAHDRQVARVRASVLLLPEPE
jgi:hypothetical protein